MSWNGFDGRVFLLPEELATYKRRPPVRYSARGFAKSSVCSVCGQSATDANPLQAAHRIPFIKGVINYGFTPDFLDDHSNLRWAHRQHCNNSVELSDDEITALASELRARKS